MEKSILIVDDSPVVRKLVGFILRKNGFKVTEAEDGMDALEKLVRDQYDLVLSDLNMPRMDGLALISELRQDPQYAKTPVIILTTEQGQDDKDRGLALGANIYLVKPTQPEMLLKCVHELIG